MRGKPMVRIPFPVQSEVLRDETMSVLREALQNLKTLRRRTSDELYRNLVERTIQNVETAIDCIRD